MKRRDFLKGTTQAAVGVAALPMVAAYIPIYEDEASWSEGMQRYTYTVPTSVRVSYDGGKTWKTFK